MDSLRFSLPWPPSTNHYWRHVGRSVLISKEGRMYRMHVAAVVRPIVAHTGRLLARLDVRLVARPPSLQRIDLDNRLKAALDACTHAGLWEDDSQIDRLVIERGPVLRALGCLDVEVCAMAPVAGVA